MKKTIRIFIGISLLIGAVGLAPKDFIGSLFFGILGLIVIAWPVVIRFIKNGAIAKFSKPVPAISTNNPVLNTTHASAVTKATSTARRLPKTYDEYYLAYDYIVSVAGVRYAAPNFDNIELAKPVDLEVEPDNEYDAEAIRVIQNGQFLGHVPKGTPKDMIFDFEKKGYPVASLLVLADVDNCDIQIQLAYYKPIKVLISGRKRISATLSKTSKKDPFDIPRYENLETSNIGELVELEYSYDSETYIVTNSYGSELGELSKSISSKLSDNDNDVIAILEELSEDENGKSHAVVALYPK